MGFNSTLPSSFLTTAPTSSRCSPLWTSWRRLSMVFDLHVERMSCEDQGFWLLFVFHLRKEGVTRCWVYVEMIGKSRFWIWWWVGWKEGKVADWTLRTSHVPAHCRNIRVVLAGYGNHWIRWVGASEELKCQGVGEGLASWNSCIND